MSPPRILEDILSSVCFRLSSRLVGQGSRILSISLTLRFLFSVLWVAYPRTIAIPESPTDTNLFCFPPPKLSLFLPFHLLPIDTGNVSNSSILRVDCTFQRAMATHPESPEEFEFIETPAAPAQPPSSDECGVKTTSVSLTASTINFFFLLEKIFLCNDYN